MTTFKRTLLSASLAAVGLLGAGVVQAAEPDVSTIYGRGSPPNAHITDATSNYRAGSDSSGSTATRSARLDEEPVRGGPAENDMAAAQPSPATADAGGEYLTTPATAAAGPDTITTPTGSYLAVDDAPTQSRAPMAAAAIHEESLDGVPLVDGRGMREGFDLHAGAPVHADPAFDVADVLGRASPPAPENAPDFGLPS